MKVNIESVVIDDNWIKKIDFEKYKKIQWNWIKKRKKKEKKLLIKFQFIRQIRDGKMKQMERNSFCYVEAL